MAALLGVALLIAATLAAAGVASAARRLPDHSVPRAAQLHPPAAISSEAAPASHAVARSSTSTVTLTPVDPTADQAEQARRQYLTIDTLTARGARVIWTYQPMEFED